MQIRHLLTSVALLSLLVTDCMAELLSTESCRTCVMWNLTLCPCWNVYKLRVSTLGFTLIVLTKADSQVRVHIWIKIRWCKFKILSQCN